MNDTRTSAVPPRAVASPTSRPPRTRPTGACRSCTGARRL